MEGSAEESEEEAGGLSAAETSDAIADRIRKRRAANKHPNYREGSQVETESSEQEEPPLQHKRMRKDTTSNNTGKQKRV